jgi:L-lysine exporter family protein LysE/ArgO
MNPFTAPAFFAGMVLSLSLIMAIGPQNAQVIRSGIMRQHLWLTVAVCVASDVVFIAIGVTGLAQLGGVSDKLLGAMTGAGALVLMLYGAQAMGRFLRPASNIASGSSPASGTSSAMPTSISPRRAIVAALAFSWLNPHAWLDTSVIIGTASLAYAQPDNAVFGLGAATGSLLWFGALGLTICAIGQRLNSPIVWRALDAMVALMMWGTAIWLLVGLF